MIKFITRVLFPPLIRILFAATIVGRGNMPAKGGVILASNHLSFFDSVIITLLSRRPVSFLAKAEYFTGKGFKGWLSKKFFESIDAIPVNRGSASAAQDALDSGLAAQWRCAGAFRGRSLAGGELGAAGGGTRGGRAGGGGVPGAGRRVAGARARACRMWAARHLLPRRAPFAIVASPTRPLPPSPLPAALGLPHRRAAGPV